MTFYKFTEDDLFVNTIEMYPEYSVYIQSGSIYLDSIQNISGANTANILEVPDGHVSLYEYNIDRGGNYIYPFIRKDSNRTGFKSQTKINFNTQFGFGDDESPITGSYRLSASISRDYYDSTYIGSARTYVNALKNKFEQYSYLSPHYQYSSSHGNKSSQTINLISIPSIMFGSSIKKGSLKLKYYITGSLVGELSDHRRNGELVQSGPEGSTGSGSIAGVVLYNEGLIVLTGSWSLDSHSIDYDATGNSKWIYFGYGVNPSKNSVSIFETGLSGEQEFVRRSTLSNPTIAETTLSASFLLEYKGTTHTQTMTMLAHAPYAELNHSNNPTFVTSSDATQALTGTYQYVEQPKTIKNIVSTQFTDQAPTFEKTTYISKVGIYDKDRNLIGVAKVATPVRKTEDLAYTFKIKLDI
jgi:hypothetical protein